MPNNSLWNLTVKIASLLAVLFLLISAALSYAALFGSMRNETAVILTVFFAVGLAIFALTTVNFGSFQLEREIENATNFARHIADGELPEDSVKSDGEMFAALQDISGNLRQIKTIADRIANGDASAQIDPRSEDDDFGQSLKKMVEKLRSSIQTPEERDYLKKSVQKLRREIVAAATGDFTAQAEVIPGMPGEIADSFNSMIKELRVLVKQVKNAAFQVSNAADQIGETTGQTARGNETQAAQIVRTAQIFAQTTSQMREISINAGLSTQVAGDAVSSAHYGTQAVRDNISAMNSIRQQVQETVKRIKKLGERAQEIGQIGGFIDDLSNQIGLLALNASLQVAVAGEKGKNFSSVAEEIEKLAVGANRLSGQIGALTQTIQNETKDVAASMDETIHEVVIGSTLADRAGQALIEIEEITARLSEVNGLISESAKSQVKHSEDISQAIGDISKVTELVQSSSRRTADSVKILVKLIGELNDAVEPFKLPEDKFSNRRPPSGDSGLYLN